ncbi:MAG: dinitrogenase iron-molybdenum cofactor biosynthesis protein [Candidatus Aenigmarchaeota archaeon]|nr:dinitrogenase iron-molybdenum cofactor biosynthesis protein [Candidatus Aenigmarchaeota archaeon]
MRICFTSDQNNGLDSVMSYHFGHCPYFVIVDVDENGNISNVESISNPLVGEHDPGELPSFMKSKQVDVIITGGMGPKAQQYFSDSGIKIVVGSYGKVRDVLEEYLQKKISQVSSKVEPSVKENETDEVERLKKEVAFLRSEIADLKSMIKNLKKNQNG